MNSHGKPLAELLIEQGLEPGPELLLEGNKTPKSASNILLYSQHQEKVGETLEAGSERRRQADQAIAADQHQHGEQERCDGRKGGHGGNRVGLGVGRRLTR